MTHAFGRPRQSYKELLAFTKEDEQLNILQTVVLTDSLHAAVSLRAFKTIYGQASRLISIGKLNMSPCLHTRPITW